MIFSKHLGRVLIGAVALTAAAPAAHGQAFSGSGCGGNTFNTCASWSGLLSNGGTTLTFNITNTSGVLASNPNSIFDEILLGNLPTSSISSFSASGSGLWTGVDNCPGKGSPCGYNMLVRDVLGGDATSPAPKNGLAAGQSTQFTFNLSAPMTTDFSGVQLAIHDLGGIGNCGTSNKVVFGPDGKPLSGYTNSCGNTSTVPEPSSMALLGTGLVGLVPVFRRKRQS